MKIRFLKFLTLLTLGLPFLAGCGEQLGTGDFDIKFQATRPIGYIGQVYDFSNILIREVGIHYDMTASYMDYSTSTMKDLEVNNFQFTPLNLSDVSIKITAYNQTILKNRTTSIRVTAAADEIDSLLARGASNFADPGITKMINLDSHFIKAGHSSIYASFSGSNPYTWGASIVCPNNFRCVPYWTDQTWSNTILTFWVYNPTDFDFEFQLRIKENAPVGIDTGVDIDWGYAVNVSQIAAKKQWSQLFFSMNRVGINRVLRIEEDLSYNDDLNVKIKWKGAPVTEDYYTYSLYIDGVDFVPASYYPDVPTDPLASCETLEDGWENMQLDNGKTASYGRSDASYDRKVVHSTVEHESTCSLKLAFDGVTPDVNIRYSLMLSPEEQKKSTPSFNLPNLSKGTLKLDLKYEGNITNKNISVIAIDKNEKGEWNDAHTITNVVPSDLGDGWYQVYFDFAKVTSFAKVDEVIRLGFSFLGVDDTNKSSVVIHVDNIIFDPDGTGPAPVKPARGELIQSGKGLDTVVSFGDNYDATKTKIVADYKLNNNTGHFAMEFYSSDWKTRFGSFNIFMTTKTGDYSGIEVETLEDGYKRLTISTWLLTAYSETKPTSISLFYSKGEWNDVSGYFDLQSVEEVENPEYGEVFGYNTTIELKNAISVTSTSKIILEIKAKTSGQICLDLMQDWDGYYFGHFSFGPGIETAYAGVSSEDLGTGYIRYTFSLGSVVKIEEYTPTTINWVYFNTFNVATGLVSITTVE